MKEENIQRSTPDTRFPTRRGFLWPIAWVLVVLIIALAGLTVFHRLESWPARTAHQSADELERVGRDLKNAFVDVAHLQPRITINNRVYLEQTTQVSELSLVSRQVEVEHEFESTWAGSSKRVKLHGTFNVKAGFDLRQSIAVDVQPDQIVIHVPHAQVLGVEQQNVDVLAFENGYWNRISGDDVQSELSVLPRLARERAEQTNLAVEAEQALQQQIEARVHTDLPIRLVFADPIKNQ